MQLAGEVLISWEGSQTLLFQFPETPTAPVQAIKTQLTITKSLVQTHHYIIPKYGRMGSFGISVVMVQGPDGQPSCLWNFLRGSGWRDRSSPGWLVTIRLRLQMISLKKSCFWHQVYCAKIIILLRYASETILKHSACLCGFIFSAEEKVHDSTEYKGSLHYRIHLL